jgi:hypothetical protein
MVNSGFRLKRVIWRVLDKYGNEVVYVRIKNMGDGVFKVG